MESIVQDFGSTFYLIGNNHIKTGFQQGSTNSINLQSKVLWYFILGYVDKQPFFTTGQSYYFWSMIPKSCTIRITWIIYYFLCFSLKSSYLKSWRYSWFFRKIIDFIREKNQKIYAIQVFQFLLLPHVQNYINLIIPLYVRKNPQFDRLKVVILFNWSFVSSLSFVYNHFAIFCPFSWNLKW